MRLKKVRTLGIITALFVATLMAGTQFKERAATRQTVEVTQEIEQIQQEVQVEKRSRGVQDFAETTAHLSVSELMIPMVGAGTEEEVPEEIEESNLIIADVTNYVNIRSLPSEEGEILGKLYDDSVGTRHGEENGWYYITSGSVTGYVKAEFVLTGEAAEVKAREVGTRLAEVTTTTLKVRMEPSTEAGVLGLVPGGDILAVLEEVEGWAKVSVEEGEGYVSTDYVRLYTENVEAESKEEEEARLRKEEEERRRAEEAARKALESQNASKKPAQSQSGSSGSTSQSSKPSGSSSSGSTSGGSAGNSTSSSNSTGDSSSGSSSAGSSSSSGSGSSSSQETDLGQQIVNYAVQFVGNPYVYGGTSLTNGADCSGFVQSVYAHFGISLPRTSGEQGASGRKVDGIENARPGDLVWYSGHIGIYMGNGKLVHASNPKNGIMISNVNYRPILGIRRIV